MLFGGCFVVVIVFFCVELFVLFFMVIMNVNNNIISDGLVWFMVNFILFSLFGD